VVRVIGPEGTVQEHVTVEDHLVVRSGVYGGIHVPENTLLEVIGQIWGGITVAAGGRAVVYGSCSGGLRNDGEAEIYGNLMGGIQGSGRTRVAEGALIDGIRGRDLDWETTPLAGEAAGGGEVTINIDADGVSAVGTELTETSLVVEGQLEFYGAAIAGAVVLADAWLMLYGVVVGGMKVESGGHLVLRGTCLGGITNDGEADVFGVVGGGISGAGQTRVAPDALIDGVRGRDLGWEAAAPLGS
jgi:hypothetical protein